MARFAVNLWLALSPLTGPALHGPQTTREAEVYQFSPKQLALQQRRSIGDGERRGKA
jgi:hypothetical protein